MEDTRVYNDSLIRSRVSLKPLLNILKKNVAEGKAGSQKLYGGLIEQLEAMPQLLEAQEDTVLLKQNHELVEMLLATIFPPTPSNHDNLYAVSYPFRFEVIYSSNLFQYLFIKPGTNQVNVPDDELGKALAKEKYLFAYYIILKKYFGYEGPDISQTVYPFEDPVTGLTKYLELSIDARFIDVNPVGELPIAPDNLVCKRTNRLLPLEEMEKFLPLSDFIFDGLAIIKVHDVTSQEIISRLKNFLLEPNSFANAGMFMRMQAQMQNLLGVKDIEVGITPFFKINGHYIFSEKNNDKSLLCRKANHADAEKLNDLTTETFRDVDHPMVFENISEDDFKDYPYLRLYYKQGVRSIILSPLKKEQELLGVLELASGVADKLNHSHLNKIAQALPYFSLGLQKGAEALINSINTIVKEQFTAVQPAVEWKFTEAALNYLMKMKMNEDAKIERISFDNVYPVFGSIDIRNSSVERASSIQLDMVEQLQMARRIISKAHKEMQFPLFQEIEYKIDKYISSVSEMLLSEEEIQIREFLSGQVTSIFNHIKSTVPALAKTIDEYYKTLDPQSGMIYKHRKEYEDSITEINDAVARFIDKEQSAAQKVFPHYFERYVTDGVEFNIYIGQSIAPKRKFDEIYLRNMKIWQLTVLARSAKLTHSMETSLPHPLKTTQLILAHSIPLSISFRTAERKFDVDGAYNIRYEIVKKRIDKVRIKDTNERLTQPGKIAIVYSQAKEANEYLEYIEFLQNQKLLKAGVEKFDLEELQGVSGLKALRVDVNFDDVTKGEQKIELSNTTTEKLLGK
jgi:hypothetical protein